MQAAITAVDFFVPKKILTNQELEGKVETSDAWIIKRTGVKERRILGDGKGTSFMIVEAGKKILNSKDSIEELGLFILATVTPDMPVPHTAAKVQYELKLENCWSFDLNAGCSGFLYALITGAQFIESGRYKKVWVGAGDKMSSIVNSKDRATCILFGDGGAVTELIANSDGFGLIDFVCGTDGSHYDLLQVPAGGSLRPASKETVEDNMHYVHQKGKEVFKLAVVKIYEIVREIIERNNLKTEDIALFIPHQANKRIINAAVERLKLTEEQVMINIEKYGNTTNATIPIAMAEAYTQGRLKKGDLVVLATFGAGVTWGVTLLKWAMD